MEEKLLLYGHVTKLDLLAQLAMTKIDDRELEIPDQKPPSLRTLDYHTTLSLGYQLWKVTNELAHEKEKWKEGKEEYERELEKKDMDLNRSVVRLEEVSDKAAQIVKCRPSPRTYTLFLQERFLCFYFSGLISKYFVGMSRTSEFLEIFVVSTPKE